MKNIYLILAIVLGLLTTKALTAQNDEFITLWVTNDGKIEIPVYTEIPGFNYNVKWYNYSTSALLGDTTNITGNCTISGLVIGDTIEVQITGYFPSICMGWSSDPDNKLKLVDVKQWGNNQWESFYNAFAGCTNLNFTATDIPLLSLVEEMQNMFEGAEQFNSDISDWNVSNVKYMSNMFEGAKKFNSDISNWDVSNVNMMNSMFWGAEQFNSDISNWNVGQVEDIEDMFRGALLFNSDIRNWDVSGVKFMAGMFEFAEQFNSDIRDWNVSQVIDMSYLFYSASSFNQDIGSWDVSSVEYMDSIFYNASSFDQSLEDWTLSNLGYGNAKGITFSGSGMGCVNYSRSLHGWAHNPNTAYGVTIEADGIEYDSIALIDIYYLSNQTNQDWEFSGHILGSCSDAITFEYITVWDTDPSGGGVSANDQVIVPASGDFTYTSVKLDLNNDPIVGTEESGDNFNSNTIQFVVPGVYRLVITPDSINGNPLGRINFNNGGDKLKLINIEQWGNFIEWSSLEGAYYGCANLDIAASDIPKLTQVVNASHAFAYSGISTLPNFNDWNMKNVTNMSFMFQGVDGFMPDMENWNVSNVTDMNGMFAGATDFNQDINAWDVSNVTNMSHMFDGASNFDKDLSGWDVSNVTDMSFMFQGASSITNIGPAEGEVHAKANGVDNWDVGQVTSMEGMFSNAIQFNGDIGNWDVGQVTSMTDMFSGAISFNGDIGNWDVGQLTANGIGGSNDISFANSGMSCGNYSLTLQGWANQSNTPLNIVVDATGMEYSPDIIADRDILINDKNWTFKGDNEDSNCFLSIEEINTSSFTIYPNPTQEQFTITGLSGYETIQLVDMTGRVLQTVESQNNTSKSINVSHLANGVYNLMISTENGQRVTQKLIKQ